MSYGTWLVLGIIAVVILDVFLLLLFKDS